MAFKDKNLFACGSASMPDSDTPTEIGGAPDRTTKVSFADLSGAADNVKVVSDAAGDTTQTVTIYGRLADGSLVSETLSLNGTTPSADSANQYTMIMKATLSANCAGNVALYKKTAVHSGTCQATGQAVDNIRLDSGADASDDTYNGMIWRGTAGTNANKLREICNYIGATKDAEVRDLPAACDGTTTFAIYEGVIFEKAWDGTNDISEVRRPFYDALANQNVGDAEKKYYEKFFAVNTHATLALTGSTVQEVAGGVAAIVAFALESSLDGTDTNGAGNNRLVAPAGYTFDSASKNVPSSGNFQPNKAIGIWIELTLAGGATPQDSFWKFKVVGGTGA